MVKPVPQTRHGSGTERNWQLKHCDGKIQKIHKALCRQQSTQTQRFARQIKELWPAGYILDRAVRLAVLFSCTMVC